MSHHYFARRLNGHPVVVRCGWDAQAARYFLTIERSEQSANDEPSVIPDGGAPVFDSTLAPGLPSEDFAPYLAVLAGYGIAVPEDLPEALNDARGGLADDGPVWLWD